MSLKNDLYLKALKGEEVSRPPVWMMRQAGRHMKVRDYFYCDHHFDMTAIIISQAYRDLCQTHKTFRERSENANVAVEIR